MILARLVRSGAETWPKHPALLAVRQGTKALNHSQPLESMAAGFVSIDAIQNGPKFRWAELSERPEAFDILHLAQQHHWAEP